MSTQIKKLTMQEYRGYYAKQTFNFAIPNNQARQWSHVYGRY